MADHIVEVEITPQGAITCKPNVKAGIRRGDRLIWAGQPHKGRIQGQIRGTSAAELQAMSSAEIAKLPLKENVSPLSPESNWTGGEVRTVRNDAPPGAFKYVIEVPGRPPFDPVIIIDP